MDKSNKYQYHKVIQQNTTGSWEDVSLYPCNSRFVPLEGSGEFRVLKYGNKIEKSLFSVDLKSYKELNPYPIRVVKRRTKTTD